MKTIFKYAVAATLTGALALAAASPSEARGGRNAAAVDRLRRRRAGRRGGCRLRYNNGYYGRYGSLRVTATLRAITPSRVMPMSPRRSMWRRAALIAVAAVGCWIATDTTPRLRLLRPLLLVRARNAQGDRGRAIGPPFSLAHDRSR